MLTKPVVGIHLEEDLFHFIFFVNFDLSFQIRLRISAQLAFRYVINAKA